MQAENSTTEHNRTIRVTGIPAKHPLDRTELLITIGYVDDENDGDRIHKAVALDNHVIPEIIAALNERHHRQTSRLRNPQPPPKSKEQS